MKIVFQTLVAFLLGVVAINAQDANDAKQLAGFDWLKQFEGTWTVESKSPDSGVASGTATMTSKAVGQHWMISKQNGKIGPVEFDAVQTIGYDAEKKEYFGTWVDSTSNFTWKLKGTLDESGKKLTLNSVGPSWTDPNKTSDYRDVYEFKSADRIETSSQMKGDDDQWKTFMTSAMTRKSAGPGDAIAYPAKSSVTPFLMFTGQAEEAIEFYKTVFPDLKVLNVKKYKAGEAGKEGTIQMATFELAGQQVLCTDSPPVHDFTFTPSFSFFVECESLDDLKSKFEKLSGGGKVMMPLNNYGFSDQFGWTSDKYGVSWQLNFNKE